MIVVVKYKKLIIQKMAVYEDKETNRIKIRKR